MYFGALFPLNALQEPDTIVVTYTGDTVVREEYLVEINQEGDTLRCGFYNSFYKNGMPDQKGGYKKNNLSGEWRLFDRNGYLEQRVNYKKGKQHGSFEKYHIQSEELSCYGSCQAMVLQWGNRL